MEVAGVGDAGGKGMGNQGRAVHLAKLRDANELREAAGPAHPRLHQGDAALLQPFANLPASGGELRPPMRTGLTAASRA